MVNISPHELKRIGTQLVCLNEILIKIQEIFIVDWSQF
jgi:hypothetical protein